MVDRPRSVPPEDRADKAAGSDEHRRIEIVHESLLREWPRLVRWRAQDEEGAVLRDQLRQVAQLWEERGRPEDLLWTGTSFKEYELWRERYEGGLSDVEETFTAAMTGHARRRRRRRRFAVVALIGALTIGLTVLAVLWQRSETARVRANTAEQQARDDARRAEAANLLSLGRLRLEGHPTAAVAHALASLERADNEPARRFAVEALWRSPMVSLIPESIPIVGASPEWSPDGRWLAIGGTAGLVVRDRETDVVHHLGKGEFTYPLGFSDDGSRLLTRVMDTPRKHQVWSLPDSELLESWSKPRFYWPQLFDRRLLTVEREDPDQLEGPLLLRERSLDGGPVDGGPVRTLGRWPLPLDSHVAADPTGSWFASVVDGRLLRWRIEALDEPPRVLGRHEGEVRFPARQWTDRIVTANKIGEVRIWNAESGRLERTLRSPADARHVVLDPSGRYIAAGPPGALPAGSLHVFDLEAPRGTEPVGLLHDDVTWLNNMSFSPRAPLLATGHYPHGVLLWNLAGPRPIVLIGQKGPDTAIAFTPDGRLVSTSNEGVALLWPLWSEPEADTRELLSMPHSNDLGWWVAVSPDGGFAVVARANRAQVLVLPLDGSPAVEHDLADDREGFFTGSSLSPDGRQVAAGYTAFGQPEAVSIRILDLHTAEVRILRPDDTTNACVVNSPSLGPAQQPYWMSDGSLISEGALGLRLWDLDDGSSRQLRACRDGLPVFGATPDSRTVLTVTDPGGFAPGGRSTLLAFDIEAGVTRELTSHGNRLSAFAVDTSGTIIITGDKEGLVRVGPLAGGDPYLLYGHSQKVTSIAVSPDGRWIASASDDDTIRLWPMPDVSKPPLHTLPHDELLAKLRSLTNLRVVEDPDSATGYNLEPEPFRGEEVPTW